MNARRGLGLGLAAAVLALGLGFLASTHASAQQGPVISLGTRSATVGTEVEIDLQSVNIPSPGLGAWEIAVVYNRQVVDVVSCTSSPTNVCNPNFAPDMVFIAGASDTGRVGTSTLTTITFSCEEEGVSDLSLIVERFADATVNDPQGINFAIQQGRITCSEPSDIPTPRRPRPRATATEEETAVVATSTPSGPIGGLPKVGGGTGGDGGADWGIAALAAAGLAGVAGYGALRLRARRASSGGRGN